MKRKKLLGNKLFFNLLWIIFFSCNYNDSHNQSELCDSIKYQILSKIIHEKTLAEDLKKIQYEGRLSQFDRVSSGNVRIQYRITYLNREEVVGFVRNDSTERYYLSVNEKKVQIDSNRFKFFKLLVENNIENYYYSKPINSFVIQKISKESILLIDNKNKSLLDKDSLNKYLRCEITPNIIVVKKGYFNHININLIFHR